MDSEIHEVAGEDRLSELPDSLIIAILSLLPMPDVVATMLLSKRWKHVWTTVPCLEFAPHHRIKFRNDFHKYQAFFSGALGRWNGYKIHKLDISFHVNDIASDALVDSWLRFAIDKQVEELCVYNRGDEYCPPQRLNFGSSITKLWLLQCSLRIDEAVPLQWDRLKSLGIQGSNSYSLSGDAIDKILSGAPLLEELILIFEEISEDLNIRSTSLKKLEIGTNVFKAGLRIWTPNLSCLEISGFLCGGCFLDVPSLTNSILLFDGEINGSTIFLRVNLFDGEINSVEAFNQVFQSIRHVEKITLSELSIQVWFLLLLIVAFMNKGHLDR